MKNKLNKWLVAVPGGTLITTAVYFLIQYGSILTVGL